MIRLKGKILISKRKNQKNQTKMRLRTLLTMREPMSKIVAGTVTEMSKEI